jgi:ribosomal protein S18 acetylase RimI-like enzyme
MTLSPLDFSATEKPRQIQENMIAYMRSFAGLPGMAMIDNAESFWFVSNRPAPGNMVLRAGWPIEGIENRIDEMFTQIGCHIDQIDWMVFPGDNPSDLGRRLEARGMPCGRGGNWLYADLTSLGATQSEPRSFHIEQVRDDQRMKEWVRVSEAGFGTELRCFYDAYARHGYGPEAFSLHYIGYLENTPVTSGSLLEAGGCASIYDVSTPAAFRRQGLGGALTHALMGEIRNRGYNDTWIWSSNMAKGVYEKLGYVAADFGLREYSWHKRLSG